MHAAPSLAGVLAAIGDLVEDIVVRLAGPVARATDTEAVIERRRGGSAANVAATAARISGEARFIGQVGDDPVASMLLDALDAAGVDVSYVRRRGRTGSIVVLVDADGERSFLTDLGDARQLDDPQREWLDHVDVVHVPLYSLAGGPIAATSETLIAWAKERAIAVTVDLSSLAVIEHLGVGAVRDLLDRLRPDAVFANADEAAAMTIESPVSGAITFVKRGASAATVLTPGRDPVDVPAIAVSGPVDSTGAGDAFAAGVLTFPEWRDEPVAACEAGHAAAAALLASRIARRSSA